MLFRSKARKRLWRAGEGGVAGSVEGYAGTLIAAIGVLDEITEQSNVAG